MKKTFVYTLKDFFLFLFEMKTAEVTIGNVENLFCLRSSRGAHLIISILQGLFDK